MGTGAARRSWGMTIFWALAAVVLASLAIAAGGWAHSEGGWADFVGWPAAVVLGGAALVAVIGIFTASSTAVCPKCGARIHAFDPGQRMVVCESCREHARIEAGVLHALTDDHVEPTPIFTAALDHEVRWAGCVACCDTATRTVTLEIVETQLAKNAAVSAAGIALVAVAGAGFVQTGGGKVWRVPIPYCDRHADHVVLDTDFGSPVIRFRAYAAYRAFLAANGLTPSQPIA